MRNILLNRVRLIAVKANRIGTEAIKKAAKHFLHYLTADGQHYKTADGAYYKCKE